MSKTKDGELLTLDVIRSGIRFQRSVAEGWIKVSKELVCTPDLLSILHDVIIYDVDDHCYGKKLVRHCPMISLFQALRWYM